MLVLDAGCRVKVLRFLPDGRLLAGSGDPSNGYVPLAGPSYLDVWTLPDGGRTRIALPPGKAWGEPNELAVTPDGERLYLALRGRVLVFNAADGRPAWAADIAGAERIVGSPDGEQFVLTAVSRDRQTLTYLGRGDGRDGWEYQPAAYSTVVGFLPDGDRFITVERGWVRVRSFDAAGGEVAATRYRVHGPREPALTADGRYLCSPGYGSLYVCDLARPGERKQIKGGSNLGDFRSFALHPTNGTLSVIHGGPTLVKLYDVATLKPLRKFDWKLGPLLCVAFSPDGTLAAAGSEGGKIVVWDVDG